MTPEARRIFDSEIMPDVRSKAQRANSIETIFRPDYIEQPVRIEQFINDPYYLGKTLRGNIYPKLIDDLIDLFSGEYSEVLLAGSIGWGKSTMAYIGICYDVYMVSCLKSPQDQFGLLPGTSLAFVNVSVNKTQAMKILFAGLFNLVKNSPYFKSMFLPEPNIQTEIRFPRNVFCYPVAANEQSLLGEGVFSAAFDEMNFYKIVERSKLAPEGGTYDQAVTLYDKLSRRIRSRMNQRGRLPGHLWMVSSARYPNDFTERKAREALDDKRIFVREYANWETKPSNFYMDKWFKVEVGDISRRSRVLDGTEENVALDRIVDVPMDYKEEFDKDPDGSLRDYAGISVLTVKPFITRREKITDMFLRGEALGYKHPYTAFTVTLQDAREQLLPENLAWITKKGRDGKETKRMQDGPYFAHIDLAKTQDACGFCVGHVIGSKNVMKGVGQDKHYETRPVIRIDLLLQIVAPKRGEIQISSVRGIIYRLRDLGMEFGLVSYDSWGSDESIQTLNAEGFTAENFSVDRSTEPYEQAKTAMYDDRVMCYRNPILGLELSTIMIDLKHNKVDHPPHGSKDLSDAFAAVVSHCEQGFSGGSTSQWKDVITISAVDRGVILDDQEALWDKIQNNIPLSEDELGRLK